MGKQDTKAGFELASSASHLLHRAQQAAITLSASALGQQGLTIRQFAVLAALYGQDGQSQSDLVAATGIDRSTLADMVSRMEKSGLIKRAVSKQDARAKTVSLSAGGKKAYQIAVRQVEAADAALLKALRKPHRAGLIAALAAIAGDNPKPAAKKRKKSKKPDKKKKKKKKSGKSGA